MGYSPQNLGQDYKKIAADQATADVAAFEGYQQSGSWPFRDENGNAIKHGKVTYNPLGSWQQNLRVIAAVKPEEVLVLPPNGESIDEFRAYLKHFFPELKFCQIMDRDDSERPFANFNHGQEVISYEDFDYVFEGLNQGIRSVSKRIKRPFSLDSEITVDVTAGLKIFSIAAALVTVNGQMLFCYATTGTEGGKVKQYNTQLQGLMGDF
jgi:hypothetical protein